MESKIKQRELNISFHVISINLEKIEKLLKQTNDQKIKNEIKDLLIIKKNGINHAEL
jgi:hypothetical protein